MTHHLPLLTTRIRAQDDEDESSLARQWRLLKLLAFAPKGFTIRELVSVSGVSDKTIRRDLVFLKEVGFDVAETVGDRGRKSWRLRRLSDTAAGMGRTGEKYSLIHGTLGDLHDVALILGDEALAFSLKRLQEWVQGKCDGKRPRPR